MVRMSTVAGRLACIQIVHQANKKTKKSTSTVMYHDINIVAIQHCICIHIRCTVYLILCKYIADIMIFS